MNLEGLVSHVKNHPSIQRKRAIKPIREILCTGEGGRHVGIGDHYGYLRGPDFYLLLTLDAIREELLDQPRYAGFCAVNVVVNDLYATGGLPLALMNCLHLPPGEEGWALEVARGIREGCDFFGLHVWGSHLDPTASAKALSVTGLGEAVKVISTFGAREGDNLIWVYDPEGKWNSDMLIWDSTSGREPERLSENYSLLLELAEEELVSACRGVSNGGVAGTLFALLEESRVGARFYLDRISPPPGISLEEWLLSYPSFGFLLSLAEGKVKGVEGLFRIQGLEVCTIGEVVEGRDITFIWQDSAITTVNPLAI
jgi:hypothetical protein